MGDGDWKAQRLSPFFTERARSRAPQILSYAAVTGAAMLVSPTGQVVLFSGAAAEVDLARIAHLAGALGGADEVVSFTHDTSCVHAGPVCMGWMLCVLSTVGAYPGEVVERLRRASAVLAMALVDGVPPDSGGGHSGPGGAPADVSVARLSARRN